MYVNAFFQGVIVSSLYLWENLQQQRLARFLLMRESARGIPQSRHLH